jgi:hypothetical protein
MYLTFAGIEEALAKPAIYRNLSERRGVTDWLFPETVKSR